MSEKAAEMDYGEEERLNFGAAYFAPKEGCETEYHLINLTKESLEEVAKEVIRGNWGNEGRSACMLLAKSCHDLDLLPWLIGKKCKKIQSFGSLRYLAW